VSWAFSDFSSLPDCCPPIRGNLTYNLTALFERHLGRQQKATASSLRFWLFTTPGIIAERAGKTTIKLAVLPRERDWWSRLWE
jgi:hypothetical protein